MKRRATIVMMAAACAAGAGAALVGSGCASDATKGYTTASTFDSSVRSISVPMFENVTYARGLEVELAQAIVSEVRRTTPWRVEQGGGGGGAETMLSGRIESSELRKLSTARETGLVEELAVQIVVNFEWRDTRSGRVLVSRRGFSAAEAFTPARGIKGQAGERLETGQHAAVVEMARAIVSELRSGW